MNDENNDLKVSGLTFIVGTRIAKDVSTVKRMSDKGERILSAAYHIFGRRGFHAVKMDDIAAEAGVAKGTLYLYYENKAELFHAVVEKILQDYLQRYEQIINDEIDIEQKLVALVRHHLLFIRERHDFAKINLLEGSFTEETKQKVMAYLEKISGLFARFLQQAYPDIFDDEAARMSFFCFSGMGDGIARDLFRNQRELTDDLVETRARFVAQLFMNGFQQAKSR